MLVALSAPRAPVASLVLVLLAAVGSGCAPQRSSAESAEASERAGVAGVRPERLRVEVVATHPHDDASYTQGLLWSDGRLYESSGGYGESSVRSWTLDSSEPLELFELDDELFGEGLALVEGRLLQLTWKSGRLLLYDVDPLRPVGERRYQGFGWGLAYDGDRVIMSDGSHVLTFRDPDSFEIERRLEVRRRGSLQADLNELELVDGELFANVYQTDEIVRIDLETGVVTAVIDASGLLTRAERRSAEVLNGIAYRPETDTFLITGKYWPKLFEVRFVPRAVASGGQPP